MKNISLKFIKALNYEKYFIKGIDFSFDLQYNKFEKRREGE